MENYLKNAIISENVFSEWLQLFLHSYFSAELDFQNFISEIALNIKLPKFCLLKISCYTVFPYVIPGRACISCSSG